MRLTRGSALGWFTNERVAPPRLQELGNPIGVLGRLVPELLDPDRQLGPSRIAFRRAYGDGLEPLVPESFRVLRPAC